MTTIVIELDDETTALIEERFPNASSIVLDWCMAVINNKVAGYRKANVSDSVAKLSVLPVEDKTRIEADIAACYANREKPILKDPGKLIEGLK